MKSTVVLVVALASGLAVPVDAHVRLNNRLRVDVADKGGIIQKVQSRIVNGSSTTVKQFPWIVSLQYFGSHQCGGSIITTNRILTAAHCTINILANYLSIRAGSTDAQTGGEVIDVTEYKNHELFNPKTLDNDVCVLSIESDLVMGPTISVIELPSQDAVVPEGDVATVAGWGDLCENCKGISPLQFVSLPVLSNEDCSSMYGDGITEGMLCAGFVEGGQDACQGDSGGPLNDGDLLIGVVSWGEGCARPNRPGVFTRVASYRTWIDELL